MSKRLILIRGLPGSGKSSLAEQIADQNDGMNYEADQFMVDVQGNYEYRQDRLSLCHRQCFLAMSSAFGIGVSTVCISNTFTQLWEMKKYIDYAASNDIELTVIKAEGVKHNKKNVPDGKIARMRKRWEDFDGEISPIQFFVSEVF